MMIDAQSTRHAFLRPKVSLHALLLVCLISSLPGLALAKVPKEFLGTWSSNPPGCKQENGEVDVLHVTRTGIEFYEIGCDLSRPERVPGATRFAGRCYKGGSSVSSGTVVMRRLGRDKVGVALAGFGWTTAEPEVFYRCKS